MRGLAMCLLALATGALGSARADTLVPNPDFDSGIDGWSGFSSAEISWDPGQDVDGDPGSGSVRIVQVRDDPDLAGLQSSCFAIGGGTYDFGGWFFVDGSQPGNHGIVLGLRVFDGPDCSGALLLSPSTNNFVLADSWFIKLSADRSVPDSAVSGRLTVSVFNRSPEPFDVLADGFFVIGRIFVDGFES